MPLNGEPQEVDVPENELHTNNVSDIQREFQDALTEEEPGTTLFDIIVKRPTTTIIALCLFGLLFILYSSISSVNSDDIVGIFKDITEVEPINAQLITISDRAIEFEASAGMMLKYSKLHVGWMNTIVTSVANKLGDVDVKLDGPVTVKTRANNNTEYDYLISLNSKEIFTVLLNTDEEVQILTLRASLLDAGRTEVISALVNRAVLNEPIDLLVQGAAVVSKYGIDYKFKFKFDQTLSVPSQVTDDFAELSEVIVQSDTNRIKIQALGNATVDNELNFKAKLPSFEWNVKIPGCDDDFHELVCAGTSHPFTIDPDQTDISVYFTSILNQLPANIVNPCHETGETKSPLDKWLTNYLTGKKNQFYVQGRSTPSTPKILNDLLTGYDIPYFITGKSASESLIRNVTVEDVMFDNNLMGNLKTVGFSGKTLVDVVLPRFLDMSSAKTALAVKAIRGDIQLFKQNNIGALHKEHFAQIIAQDWIETISLSNSEGYKVTCYFDKLPMQITNSDAFSKVSNEMLFSGHSLIDYDAVVDIEFETLIGSFVAQKIHISGQTDMRAR